MTQRPEATEYPPFYGKYVALVQGGDLLAALRAETEYLHAAIDAIPESKGSHAYAEGKWTVKTLLGHMIDAERIFSYRTLRLARGDSTPLPGFEENNYAKTANSDARSVADLAAELKLVRESTTRLFESLPADAWSRTGTVNNGPITARAIGYVTAGHARHHLNVLKDRYGL
jgi:hypothetical protein